MRNNNKIYLLILTPVLALVFFARSLQAMDFPTGLEEILIKQREESNFRNFIRALERNLYDDLGLESSATLAGIKKAHRALATLYHPDKNPSSSAAEPIRVINEAYEVLSDVNKRIYYDRQVRWGLAPASDPNKKAIAASGMNDAVLESALTSADTEKLQGILSQLTSMRKPLPDTILETVVNILTTASNKAPLLAKIELLFAHDPSLYCKTVHDDTLLHLFATMGIPDGVKLYLNNEKHAAKAFEMRNGRAIIPLACAVGKFVDGINNNWYKGRPNVISREKALEYCTIIKGIGRYQHQNNTALLSILSRLLFQIGPNYPYIAHLLDSAGVEPTEQDKKQFPILERVAPADCKLSYEPLLAFGHNGLDRTLHTLYHVKQFIDQHGFDCLVLLPGQATPVSLSMVCLQAKDQRIIDYVLEKLTTLDPTVVIETAIRSHNSTLLTKVNFDISGKENQLLSLFFQSISYDAAHIKEQAIILQTLLNHPRFQNRHVTVNNMPLPHFIYDLKKKHPALPDAWVEAVYACPNIDINIRHNGLTPLLHHVMIMEMAQVDDKLYAPLLKRDDLNIRLSCNKKTAFWVAMHNQFYDFVDLCLAHPSFHMSLWTASPKDHPTLIDYMKIHAGYNEKLAILQDKFDHMHAEYRKIHPQKKPQQNVLPPAPTIPAIEAAPVETSHTTQSSTPQLSAPHPFYLFGGLAGLVLLSAAIHKYWLKPKQPIQEDTSDEHENPIQDSNEVLPMIETT
jgi:hypothetical protein